MNFSRSIDNAFTRMRRGVSRRFLPLLLFCLFPLLSFAAGERVLFISSYHPGFPTFFQQVEGLRSEIEPAGITLDVEFMDTKRFSGTGYEALFLEQLRFKLAKVPAYDAFIVADDAALRFALDHRQELFAGRPVIFCGVNNQELAHELSGTPDITGVIESISLRETLEALWRLRPGLKTVHALVDGEPGGQGDLRTYLEQREFFAGKSLQVLDLSDMTWNELRGRMSVLGPDEAILLLSAYRDRDQVSRSFEDALAFILKHADVPVLHLWEHGLGQGILGGRIISHLEQGRIAGQLTRKILAGTPAHSIPVVEGSEANRYVFDHAVLTRFGIRESLLPPGSEVRGKPVSIFSQYGAEILVAIVVLGVQMILVGALISHISRLRRAQARIKDSEKRYRALFDANSDGILAADVATRRFVFANPAVCRMFGCSEEDFRALTVDDIHPPEHLDEVLRNFTAQASGQQDTAEALPCLRRDGSVFSADIRSFLLDFHGTFCAVGLFRDVTERSRILDTLRQAQERLSLAIAGSNDGIWDWDRVSDQVYFSPRWKEIIGYEDHELRNDLEEWRSRIHPEDRARVLDVNNQFFTSSASHFVIEYRLRHKDGSYRWVMGRGTCLRDKDGVPYRMAGSHADITERKAMELELVNVRDAALAASVAKSAFLANMSHEIRTPLNGMMGMLQLLDCSSLSGEQRDYVRMAELSGRRLTALLADILDISRIEAGKLVLTERAFDLEEMRDSIITLFSLPARKKDIRFDVELAPDLPSSLVGDDLRLRQILFNLVGNAIKFTGEGFVHTQISLLSCLPDNGCRLLFCVSDSGEGISDELLPTIFEPFVQGEGSYVRRHQGAGLGLAIVGRLMHMMGGALAIDSSDSGSTICFSMSFKTPEDAKKTGVKHVRPEESGHRSLHILLAEDDPVNMFAAQRILAKAGHVVTTASDGGQALELLRGAEFDLILMDVQMPVMDGLEATAAIRADQTLGEKSGIPIVAMTAFAMSGDREKFLAGGMDGYIAKPLDSATLHKTIFRVVSRKSKEKTPDADVLASSDALAPDPTEA
ncbi:PAS domain S-box-containing protein [Desulfomicrobium norvegicum]|uniref:histidine kinase n=1 Tax=Desulfomicrobium norvegicum (strain DSM 1741 / NCIMB 8310) TaxID=52561 RepID=A0A8G2C2T2_DESNO|nr:PAS domain-containing protein [Desulfomicrobium norvegicum]SFL71286.1 PAS domain S-box-containing protein [Desulfomicrobium norvegicum]